MFAKSNLHLYRVNVGALAKRATGLITACCLAILLTSANAYAVEKYVFVIPSVANPYWVTVKQGIEDASKEQKITPVILSATSDQAKEEFLNLCQAAISQNPAIIVICTTSDTMTTQCLRVAQNHHVKVALLDTVIPSEMIKKAGVSLSFSVATDNVRIGKNAAQFVAGQNKKIDPKVLILEGVIGNTCNANRVSGFKKQLMEALPKAKIVNSVSAEWDRLKAMNITADTLTRTGDLNVIFAANDTMALGAAEAVRLAGKTNQIMIVGVDGIPDARKAILSGRMTASVAQLPYLIGRRSVELAKESVSGHTSSKNEETPSLVLTKSVLEARSDKLLNYVR